MTLGTEEKERRAILWQCDGCGSPLTGFKKHLTGLDRTYVSQEENKFCPCPWVHFWRQGALNTVFSTRSNIYGTNLHFPRQKRCMKMMATCMLCYIPCQPTPKTVFFPFWASRISIMSPESSFAHQIFLMAPLSATYLFETLPLSHECRGLVHLKCFRSGVGEIRNAHEVTNSVHMKHMCTDFTASSCHYLKEAHLSLP